MSWTIDRYQGLINMNSNRSKGIGDVIVADDPIWTHPITKESSLEWWNKTFAKRLENCKEKDKEIIIISRLHDV